MYQEKYEYWKNHPDLDEKLREELNGLSEKEIEDCFYTDVKFQTAGMRGLMGVGTNRINIHTIRKATMGFINYIHNISDSPKVAISYDNRRGSREFAYDCARMLASHDIETFVASSLRPTPELSYMVRYYKCDGGIMITASHNPKEYNGYKLYDKNGCQLIPELAQKVIDEIEKLDDVLSIKPDYTEDKHHFLHEVDKEVDRAYYDDVLGIRINPEVKKDFVIAFSPEHGASNMPVRECLKEAGYNVVCVESQCVPDPDFGATKTPNPEEKGAYEEVLKLAEAHKAELLLVCDPDGDRMGVGILHHGEYVVLNGNQTGALLLEYILHANKEKGITYPHPVMFNTIVTSDIGEEVAKYYGVETEKTLTGFKYIGDKVAKYEKTNEKQYVFGYEESYGSLIKPFVRDKDATQACVMLAEACAYYREKGQTLYDVMNDIYDRLGAFYDSQLSISLPGQDGALRLQEIMQNTRTNPITEIEGNKVVKLEDYKLRKIYENGTETDLTGFDVADVLKYYFEDGSFVAIRPSGTEPKCKVYFSIKDKTYEEAKAKDERYHKFMAELLK